MYLSANINTCLYPSTTIKITHAQAIIHLNVSDSYFHALGAMHGSVYFKLLDDAAFFAVNSRVPDVFVLTHSFNIHFKRPVMQGKIQAIGRWEKEENGRFYAKSELYDTQEKLVASGEGVFVKSRMKLTPEIGYL